jgi:hypothetical protein
VSIEWSTVRIGILDTLPFNIWPILLLLLLCTVVVVSGGIHFVPPSVQNGSHIVDGTGQLWKSIVV